MTGGLILRNGSIVTTEDWFQADLCIQGGRIKEIGSGLKAKQSHTEIDCSGFFIYPGLINSHDHLEFNLFPRLGEPPYLNAYEWGKDLQKRWQKKIQSVMQIPLRYRLLWGAWKNLFSGVTTVVHHNKRSFYFDLGFPIDILRRYTFAHSLEFDGNLQRSINKRKPGVPFVIHLAEGIDELSSNEVFRLNKLGGIDDRTVAVHAVGITESDVELLRTANASVVWCPSSNFYLFNKTAPVDSLRQKVALALGTDSTLTGSLTLFDELRIAQKASSFSAKDLFKLVTEQPRKIFRLPSDAGKVTEGGKANFFILLNTASDPYENLLKATPGDIGLLVKDGDIVSYDRSLANFGLKSNGDIPLIFNGQLKYIRDAKFQKLFQIVKLFLSHYDYLHSEEKKKISTSTGINLLVCPSCRRQLEKKVNAWVCTHEAYEFETTNGIPDFVLPARRNRVDRFLKIYQTVRRSEDWGSRNPEYYQSLPYRDPTGKHKNIWRIRSRTFETFLNELTIQQGIKKRILDLGAGNCWLSLRLARMGYDVIAVDVNLDEFDGLGVVDRIRDGGTLQVKYLRAEFDYLPFPERYFDTIVFNASLHYVQDPYQTLLYSMQFLKDDGAIYVLDSPIYRNPASGVAMVEDRIKKFKIKFGFNVPQEFTGTFLTYDRLEGLRNRCSVQFVQPRYGFKWDLRRYLASSLRRREPASFEIIKIQKHH